MTEERIPGVPPQLGPNLEGNRCAWLLMTGPAEVAAGSNAGCRASFQGPVKSVSFQDCKTEESSNQKLT